jgi:hypothetical protein
MTDPANYPKAFLPITQRIRAAFATILKEEGQRAVQEGLPSTVVFEGALNTLLWIAARIACSTAFPGDDPDSKEGNARISRVQRAVSQAFVTVITQEKQRGHA